VFFRKVKLKPFYFSIGLFCILGFAILAHAQQDKIVGSADWEKVIDAAKKEGKVTISLPASNEMKKQIEEQFKKRYGIEVETYTARGSSAVRRMADEFKAGVRYFDLHIGGSSSIVSGMLNEGILDPVEPWLVLPEVKDPKQWWGGHLWVDNAKRFVYSFQAYLSEVIWYNTDLVKPNEIRSMDDFLNPKWKGRIGYLDPRTPGSGAASRGRRAAAGCPRLPAPSARRIPARWSRRRRRRGPRPRPPGAGGRTAEGPCPVGPGPRRALRHRCGRPAPAAA